MIHGAYVDHPKHGRNWFVSLDGRNWLPVSCDPTGADLSVIQEFFNPKEKNFRPMTMGTSLLYALGTPTFIQE